MEISSKCSYEFVFNNHHYIFICCLFDSFKKIKYKGRIKDKRIKQGKIKEEAHFHPNPTLNSVTREKRKTPSRITKKDLILFTLFLVNSSSI